MWTPRDLLAGVLVGVAAWAHAQPAVWTDDPPAAMAQAQRDGKDLLLLFTGSDWCPPCFVIQREVFDTAVFADAVRDRFVLVTLDFPRRTPPAESAPRHAQWADRLGIAGYPTVVLADAGGRPYAFTGYHPGGAEAYVTRLDALASRKALRDALLASAASAEGPDRAGLIDQALKTVAPEPPVAAFTEEVDALLAADADGALGLRAEYQGYRDSYEWQVALRPLEAWIVAGDWDSAYGFVDKMIRDRQPRGQTLQALTAQLAQFRYQQQRYDEAKRLLDDAIALSPDSRAGQQLQGLRQRLFDD